MNFVNFGPSKIPAWLQNALTAFSFQHYAEGLPSTMHDQKEMYRRTYVAVDDLFVYLRENPVDCLMLEHSNDYVARDILLRRLRTEEVGFPDTPVVVWGATPVWRNRYDSDITYVETEKALKLKVFINSKVCPDILEAWHTLNRAFALVGKPGIMLGV